MKRQTSRSRKEIAKKGLVGLLTVSMCLSTLQGISFADSRTEVGGVEVNGRKITLSLSGTALRAAAEAALADATLYDDQYIGVSKDERTQAAYEALTDGSNPLYELTLFSDGEIAALEEAGVEVKALIQMDQEQAEANGNLEIATESDITKQDKEDTQVVFSDPDKENEKELVLYRPGSLFGNFYDQFSNKLMHNAAETDITPADPTTYELNGEEKVTFLFINHADESRVFNIDLNGKTLEKGIKVLKAESTIKGVMGTLDITGIPETKVEESIEAASTEAETTIADAQESIDPAAEATDATAESNEASDTAAENAGTSDDANADAAETTAPQAGETAEPQETLPQEGHQEAVTESAGESTSLTEAVQETLQQVMETIADATETIGSSIQETVEAVEETLGVIKSEASENSIASASDIEAPETETEANEAEAEENTEASKAETTAEAETVKPDMEIELEKERKDLLKDTHAADLVDDSVASAKVLQYTLDDLSKSYWSAEIEGRYEVSVFAEDSAFAEPVQLELKELEKPAEAEDGTLETSKDTLTEQQVNALKAEGAYENSQSIDISFVNADGVEVEPASPVKVRIKVYKEALPEDADVSTMQIKHLSEKTETISVDTVAEYRKDTSISLGNIKPVDADGNIAVLEETVEEEASENEGAETEPKTVQILSSEAAGIESTFDVASFSTFSIIWGSTDNPKAQVTVHYVDENGKEVATAQSNGNMTLEDNQTKTMTELRDYQGGVSGYDYIEARLFPSGSKFDSNGGALVTSVKADANKGGLVFYNAAQEAVDTDTGVQYIKAKYGQYGLDDNNNLIDLYYSYNGQAYLVGTSDRHDEVYYKYNKYYYPYNGQRVNKSNKYSTIKKDLYLIYRSKNVPTGGDEKPLSLEDPTTSKTLTPNGDGTYQLTLSVTGQSVSKSGKTKANVIVVFDSSGSMKEQTKVFYGFVNQQYVEIQYLYNGWYYFSNSEWHSYTGNIYEATQTRLEVAKQAVNSLANKLMENNNLKDNDPDNDDIIQMAFIDFATKVKTTDIRSYTKVQDFQDLVNSTTAEGGTNWEDALNEANKFNFEDKDPVYVIFVSDGNPTFRDNANGYRNDWSESEHVYGTGNSDPDDRNLHAAQTIAASIVAHNKHLYMIGAFGNADNMQKLNEHGKYYNATDQTTLNNAFANIISDIQRDLKYTDVSITDGITDLTAKTAIVGTAADFNYAVTGESITDAEKQTALAAVSGTAHYDEGSKSVIWNLGIGYHLIPGATYSVSFTVWPTQEAYDTIAELNNGTKTWEEVQKKYPNQFVRSKDGPNYTYALRTNTTASVSYKTIETTNGVEGTPSEAKEGAIKDTPSMSMGCTTMKVQKVWDDRNNTANRPQNIILKVYRDQETYPYQTINLSAPADKNSNTWESSIYIAPGLIVNGTTREAGHDYRLVEEGNDIHYDFETQTIHPMLTVKNSKEEIVDSISGETITTFTATNILRGDIEVRKKVVDSADHDISSTNVIKDIPFTFELKTLTKPTGKELTDLGENYQKDGQYAVGAQLYDISYSDGKETEKKNGEEFKLKAGDSFSLKPTQKLKLLNVPVGTTYEIVEENATGYKLDETKTQDTSGTTEGNKNYVATFTNKVQPVDITFQKARKPSGSENDQPLELLGGVKLQITKKVSDTETVPVKIQDKPNDNGTFEITEDMKSSGMTLSLPDGEYTIKEVKAPDGYQMLTKTFTFKVINGEIDQKAFVNEANVSFNREGDKNIITIFNTPGRVLPGTGGMGTFLYNLSGLALMLTALVYIIHARHRQKGGLN